MTAVKRGDDEKRQVTPGRTEIYLDPGTTRSIILAGAALVIFLYLIRVILLPFVLAAIVAYIFTPLLDWLARRTQWPRLLFAVVLFLILLGGGSLFVIVAGKRIALEMQSIATDLRGTLTNLIGQATGNHPVELFGYAVDPQQIVQTALERMRDWIAQTDQIALVAGYSLAGMIGVFLAVVLLFYFLTSGRRIADGLLWLVPPHRRPLVMRIWTDLDPVLMRYFVGMIGVVIYATIASYIGLGVILGIEHAVLLALLTGILETVPVIGSTSAAILAGLVSLRTATGLMSIVDYALYATALRLSIDQLVGPVVLGRAAHVHPVLIIFCFLAGGVVFGIPGVILAVPVALLVKSTLATLYDEDAD